MRTVNVDASVVTCEGREYIDEQMTLEELSIRFPEVGQLVEAMPFVQSLTLTTLDGGLKNIINVQELR